MTDPRVASMIHGVTAAANAFSVSGASSVVLISALGRTVEVCYPRFADSSPIPLANAFVPSTTEIAPSYRISLLDEKSAGRRPPVNWPLAWLAPLGALRESLASPCAFALDVEHDSISSFCPDSRDAVTWYRDLESMPYWARATPFRIPLSWIAHTFGGEMIHGAGVVFDDQAVLLLGPGGAGKSTLALAAAQSGLPLLGDDFLMVSGLEAQAIYRRVKAHDETLEILADGSSIGPVLNADAPGEKRILELDPRLLHVDPISIGALVVPRIGVRARPTRMAAPEFLRRVLYPSMQGLLGGSGVTLKVLANLARCLPAYELEVGPHLQDNVRALGAIAYESREVLSLNRMREDSA